MRLTRLVTGACAAACLSLSHTRGGDAQLRVALGGDVMFGRWVDGQYRRHSHELDPLLAARLREADLSLVNLETGLCSEQAARKHADETRPQRFRLTAPPERLATLRAAGVDVAIVANNHVLDCGERGLVHTVRALERHAIVPLGAREPGSSAWPSLTIVRKGVTLLVLAATLHAPPLRARDLGPAVAQRADERVIAEVRALREVHGDAALLVSLHWGTEGAAQPSEDQRTLARALIDAGADLVFGHGPHVAHAVESHRDGLILYSVGNLLFDMHTPQTLFEITLRRVGPRYRPGLVAATSR